jgi:hypothetical protein
MKVQNSIAEEKFTELYVDCDQLGQEMRKNQVFYGFTEGFIEPIHGWQEGWYSHK